VGKGSNQGQGGSRSSSHDPTAPKSGGGFSCDSGSQGNPGGPGKPSHGLPSSFQGAPPRDGEGAGAVGGTSDSPGGEAARGTGLAPRKPRKGGPRRGLAGGGKRVRAGKHARSAGGPLSNRAGAKLGGKFWGPVNLGKGKARMGGPAYGVFQRPGVCSRVFDKREKFFPPGGKFQRGAHSYRSPRGFFFFPRGNHPSMVRPRFSITGAGGFPRGGPPFQATSRLLQQAPARLSLVGPGLLLRSGIGCLGENGNNLDPRGSGGGSPHAVHSDPKKKKPQGGGGVPGNPVIEQGPPSKVGKVRKKRRRGPPGLGRSAGEGRG